MNGPMQQGMFDPLQAPGSSQAGAVLVKSPFESGSFVSAMIDNTAFFNKRPSGDAEADQLLPRGTSMKVISGDSSHIKVELDSGEVGWVPTMMVEDPSRANVMPIDDFATQNPNEVQIYPAPITDDPIQGGAIPIPPEPGVDSVPLPDVPGSREIPLGE
ncbi:MAG: hypothetical protein ACO3RV_04285 [Luteolibacter sp.]